MRALHALLVLALAVAPLPVAEGQANTVSTLNAKFPAGAEGVAAAYVDPYVYFFGGYNGTSGGRSDIIYRLHPTSGIMTTVETKLPRPMHGVVAAATGGKVYLFGGFATVSVPREPAYKDWVQIFDPANGTMTTSDETFAAAMGNPTSQEYGFYYMSAAAVDGKVYVLGGANGEGQLKVVFQYDPATDELTKRNAALAHGLSEASAAAVGQDIYVFGGMESDTGGDGPVDVVQKYNVAADRFDTFSGTLDEPVRGTSAAARAESGDAWIFGGQDRDGEQSRAIQHLHMTSFVDPAGVDLPGPRTRSAAVWTGQDFIIAGGLDGETRLRDILRFRPSAPTQDPIVGPPTTGSDAESTTETTPAAPALLALAGLVAAAWASRRR